MIGKISRGSRPGDIGRYLHGEGHLGEHVYRDEQDRERGHKPLEMEIAMASSSSQAITEKDAPSVA